MLVCVRARGRSGARRPAGCRPRGCPSLSSPPRDSPLSQISSLCAVQLAQQARPPAIISQARLETESPRRSRAPPRPTRPIATGQAGSAGRGRQRHGRARVRACACLYSRAAPSPMPMPCGHVHAAPVRAVKARAAGRLASRRHYPRPPCRRASCARAHAMCGPLQPFLPRRAPSPSAT